MGMSAITSDMAKQRRALLSSFMEAEASASMRLAEVDAVRSAVEAACNTRLPSSPQDAIKDYTVIIHVHGSCLLILTCVMPSVARLLSLNSVLSI